MTVLHRGALKIHQFLQKPMLVLIFCMYFVFVSLLLNGGLIRLFGLHRDQQKIKEQIVQTKIEISQIDKQIKMSQDPTFIKRQAMDIYDLVDENDLVFIFAEN